MMTMTVPIQDENRTMLAYNMLAYIGENRGQFLVDGHEVGVNRNQLVLLDENKNTVEPVIDRELFGTEEDKEARQEGRDSNSLTVSLKEITAKFAIRIEKA